MSCCFAVLLRLNLGRGACDALGLDEDGGRFLGVSLKASELELAHNRSGCRRQLPALLLDGHALDLGRRLRSSACGTRMTADLLCHLYYAVIVEFGKRLLRQRRLLDHSGLLQARDGAGLARLLFTNSFFLALFDIALVVQSTSCTFRSSADASFFGPFLLASGGCQSWYL